ncbi:helix-turn-helix transcriptional regulator [Promicromonospora panici]|uniref:helix-turn-helix transcriptional regulator n=1 Tax=Promicromonospora panici TaxID=2219658 RepID=UPI00101D1326|nr:helix-turn-helix transcriptional regulator [Promicromonospora panici]
MSDLTSVTAISDPEERAKTLSALIDENQATGQELARLRKEALEELLAMGRTQTQLAELLGISRSRISMMLSAGTRPERAFFGTGRVTFAIGSKQETGRSDPSNMLSAETFAAYETLANVAKASGLDSDHEIVPPPGLVDLNRPNLVVLTSPRLLPFVGQAMGADPHLGFANDQDGWFLVDRTTGKEYRSPRDQGEPTDYAYIGRLPRPDGKGTFLYLAGIHAQGTLGAAQFVADHLKDLHKDLKTKRFSTLVACKFDPNGDRKILTTERITPLYRHEGT